jgi:Na+/H+-translocating membrane pyrophosphatase
MSLWLTLAIAAGLLAVLYGAVQTASLMRASPGNAKMQEIAAGLSVYHDISEAMASRTMTAWTGIEA